ncbi:MAG: signal peptidase II [Acidiferrobacterales bacterium]
MIRLLWVAVLILILDQASKLLALEVLAGPPIAVLPFFNLNLTFNSGAAFGFLNQASGWQNWFFIAIAFTVSVVIVFMIRSLTRRDLQTAVALSFILGGAIGNLADRVRLGYVVDFIQLYYKTWSWPVFNVADSAIFIGAILLALDMFGIKILSRNQKTD